MSVRMRHTRGHTRNRRSHHKAPEPQLAKCADCGSFHLMHRVCENCGKYRGRVVIDMEKEAIKKEIKAKRKKKEMEQTGIKKETKKGTDKTEESPKRIGREVDNMDALKPLNPQNLSSK